MPTATENQTTTMRIKRVVHAAVKQAAEEDYTKVGLWVEKVVREALKKRKGNR